MNPKDPQEGVSDNQISMFPDISDSTDSPKPKKKRGRPKKARTAAAEKPKTKMINVAVDLDTFEQMQAAKAFFGDATKYINTLIKEDLKANGEKYRQYLIDLAARIGGGK